MPRGREKSGRFRKVSRKTPGGRVVVHFEERTPKKAHCGNCGAQLHGIPRMMHHTAKNTPKSKKTVARPYGGQLCSRCMREHIKSKI